MPRIALLLAVLACVPAAGCGQRGDLYLRDQPPPGLKPPKTEPVYTPVPYPAAPKSEDGGPGKPQ
ncbi:MAG: hypothetical protein O2975_03510 [Proteobacteria bacterium]|nr:hypothetical protein [Pseudomonadota bacterium]